MDMLRAHRTYCISLMTSWPLPAMRDMYRATLIRRANQIDHGILNPHVHMYPVSYQVLQMATTQTTDIIFTRHLYNTGPTFSHIAHRNATHCHSLQREHANKMDAGQDQNHRAFQLSFVTVCLP